MRRFSRYLILAGLLAWVSACSSTEEIITTPVDGAPAPSETVVAPSEEDRMDQIGGAQEGDPLSASIPVDPDVHIGTLANGLTYIIRTNDKPENRAELRLAINAGSILEDDHQLGLAHFVEHMAFNGTRNFEKQELVDYLESIGTRFGPDLNAYTSFDETVYMLQVRTDSLEQMETGFQILREWAGDITFVDEEIDKERGVVTEEWRLGRGASARMQDEQFPIIFHGSRYAVRLPIGDPDILQNAPYEALRSFYRDWYRPDLMAVIAVGDFDPDQIETFIKDKFSDLTNPENPRERSTYDLPGHSETLFALATDPEAPYGTVGVLYKHEYEPTTTLGDLRQSLVESLYNGMFNNRLQELTQSTDPPFSFAGSGSGSFVRNSEIYSLNALVSENGHTRALEVLLTEAERVKRYGFTESEFERQKSDFMRGLERSYNERDKTESRRFVSQYVDFFLEQDPIPGIAAVYELAQREVPTITLDEINTLATKWIRDSNRVITADGPEKEGVSLPNESDLLAVFDAVASKEITPYEDSTTDAPLLADIPEPGAIVDEETDETLGVTRIKLSNGIEVVMKPTDFKNDEVIMSATSPGGSSLHPESDDTPAGFAGTLIGQSGVGEFGPIELQKKLSGQVVNVSPNIGERSEGFSGSASPQDLETLFQLVHLYFTEPRADSTAYVSFKKRIGQILVGFGVSPESAFSDTITVTMSRNHIRRRPWSQAILDEMDLNKSFEIYRERFAEAGDFRFYFVGNFEVDELKSLARTYLGSLPSIGREEEPVDVGVYPPEGIVEKTVYKGVEPKSQVQIIFTGPFEYSRENRLLIQSLSNVLSIKLREVLREDLGGTYGVRVGASPSKFPREAYQFSISFGCDPERVEELTETVFSELNNLKTNGITEDYIVKVRETAARQLEINLKENRYWLSRLSFSDTYNEDPILILEGSNDFMDTLNPDMIQDAAQRYLNMENYARFVLKPETSTEQ